MHAAYLHNELIDSDLPVRIPTTRGGTVFKGCSRGAQGVHLQCEIKEDCETRSYHTMDEATAPRIVFYETQHHSEE
jgi:hypothetical protein